MNTISNIKKIYTKSRYLGKSIICLYPFLQKGIYSFRTNKIIKQMSFPFFIKFNSPTQTVLDSDYIGLFYGGWFGKILAFSENSVYSFYNKKHKKEIEYIEKYIDEINYPKSEIYKISLNKMYTIAELVKGQSYNEVKHTQKLAKDILKYNSSSKLFSEHRFPIVEKFGLTKVPFYLQHGDLTSSNIIWSDEQHYKIIDFDTIDVFPCFYDLFRLLMDLGEVGIRLYIDGEFDAEIKYFMDTKHINCDLEDFKDSCLGAFILCTYNFWNTNKIFNKFIPEHYSKTIKIISEL